MNLWSGQFFPAMTDTAEEFCFNFQGPFRIGTVLPSKGAARNGPGNLSHLPTSLKLFLYALSIKGLSWSLPYLAMEKEEIKSIFMRTSLWNVTVFENYLGLQVKHIWILNYLLSGRKKHYWNIYIERKPMYFKIYVSKRLYLYPLPSPLSLSLS